MSRRVSKTIAAALVTLRPGALREMHWHPNADEWQYWIKGSGRMTVFDSGPRAVTMDFNPGDIGENVVRTVTENSRTLKFTTHGFEEE